MLEGLTNTPTAFQQFMNNIFMDGVCWGRDWVTNGAGKVSGLWGATLSGSSQSQLPVCSHSDAQGGACMYRPPYDHHGLCLQVNKMIQKKKKKIFTDMIDIM